MKQSLFPRVFLIVAGLIGFSVGVGQLFFPVAFEASSGVSLSTDINLLSEFRSAGGSLFLLGVLIASAAFRRSLIKHALFLAAVLYLGYGFARLYAFFADGIPNRLFIVVATIEMVMGAAAFLIFYQVNRTAEKS